MKIAVIGAGASGIIASLKASEKHEVTLFDSNDKCGKKILVTGSGRCNYWNSNISLDKYNTDDVSTLKKIITTKNANDTLAFLSSLGIYPKIKDGYFYPYSNMAISVREIFESRLDKQNIHKKYNFKVENIYKENNFFVIEGNNEKYLFDKVIIASGSKAYPKTGSCGDSYKFASKFNLKVNDVFPSLVQVRCKENFLKDLNGIRCDATISLYEDNTIIKHETGELQITDYGLSGICIFNISSIISKNINKHSYQIKVNFLPNDFDFNYFNKEYNLSSCLETIINYKLINIILKKCNISKDAYYKSLTNLERQLLKQYLSEFPFDVVSTNSFDKGQVCTGGVSLTEINENMSTLKDKDLFLTGELLDVDGICGGFNLAFAFITGFIAGSNI